MEMELNKNNMNKEKKVPVLTLEHLSPYLPYGLNVMSKVTEYTYEVIGLSNDELMIAENAMFNGWYAISNFKPILRPLSDLTKAIKHNGEWFVPLVELLCLRYNRESFDIVEIKDNYMRISWDKVRSRIDTFMYSESTQSFVFINQESGKQYRIPYQLGMFKKMYSWYFDVDDLIGCELAIDINSIEGKETKGNG